MEIRSYKSKDQDQVLALNESLVHFLSPLKLETLAGLIKEADLAQVVEDKGKILAFLLGLGPGKAYDSENYRYFMDHYRDFFYIDRVVVDPLAHRQGLGRALYSLAFTYAKNKGVDLVTAEIDLKPYNQVSLDFHKSLGFREVDRQWICSGEKQVSLQVKDLNKKG